MPFYQTNWEAHLIVLRDFQIDLFILKFEDPNQEDYKIWL